MCGIVSASQSESVSLQNSRSLRQRSCSVGESSQEKGSSGEISLRRITLRWTFVEAGERLYSQAWKVVKLQAGLRSYQRSAAPWISDHAVARAPRQRFESSPQTSPFRPVKLIRPDELGAESLDPDKASQQRLGLAAKDSTRFRLVDR